MSDRTVARGGAGEPRRDRAQRDTKQVCNLLMRESVVLAEHKR